MIVTIEYVPTPHLNNNNNIGCGTQHMLEGCPSESQLKSHMLIDMDLLTCISNSMYQGRMLENVKKYILRQTKDLDT